MTKMMKEVFMAFFCAICVFMLIAPVSGRQINSMSFLIRNWYCIEQREKIEAAKTEEAEKIHTYYINVGGHSAAGCHDYTAYPSYSFNTETGEWSDGGNYYVYGDYLCEVNKYGEKTKIGFILAVEYGDRLINNYCS